MKFKLSSVVTTEEESAEIFQWYKKEGEAVAEGDNLLEVLVGKASVDVQSPVAGTLKKILCEENEIVGIDDEIAEIE